MTLRKTLLLGLVTTVVTAIVAAATMFFARGGVRAAEAGMGPCAEGSTYDCIPNLKAGDLTAALRKRGFVCDNPAIARGCYLEIGDSLLSVEVGNIEGRIGRLTATMRIRADSEPSEGTMALLRWVARLPFAHDSRDVGEVDAWLTRQVAAKKDVDATIAGYRYHLDSRPGSSDRRTLRLDIQQSLES